jgi:hypothetical protein
VRRLLLAGAVAVLALASPPAALAEKEWAVTLLGGQYSGSKLLEVPAAKVDFKDSYTAGLSLSYEFVDWGKHIRWELEGHFLKHIGEQDHVELAASINARWITFPWNRYVETTAAVGGGLSVTTEVPVLEKRDPENSHAGTLLHYLLLEATFGPPGSPWSVVTRIHHRSGIFGLFSHSGSNVISAGIRYRF